MNVGALTAGKKLVGKAIPQSDDTYLTTLKLKESFQKIKAQLTIQPSVKPENHQGFEQLQITIANQQREITDFKTRLEASTMANERMERELHGLKDNYDNKLDEISTQHNEMREELHATRETLDSLNEYISDEMVDSWDEEKYQKFIKKYYPEVYEQMRRGYEQMTEAINILMERLEQEKEFRHPSAED